MVCCNQTSMQENRDAIVRVVIPSAVYALFVLIFVICATIGVCVCWARRKHRYQAKQDDIFAEYQDTKRFLELNMLSVVEAERVVTYDNQLLLADTDAKEKDEGEALYAAARTHSKSKLTVQRVGNTPTLVDSTSPSVPLSSTKRRPNETRIEQFASDPASVPKNSWISEAPYRLSLGSSSSSSSLSQRSHRSQIKLSNESTKSDSSACSPLNTRASTPVTKLDIKNEKSVSSRGSSPTFTIGPSMHSHKPF